MCCLKAKSPGLRDGYGVGGGRVYAGHGSGLPTCPSGKHSHPSPFCCYPTWLLELQDLWDQPRPSWAEGAAPGGNRGPVSSTLEAESSLSLKEEPSDLHVTGVCT